MPAPFADGWNHNAHYHDQLLGSVPRACGRALDVGCGLGTFARRLSTLAGHVDAVDRDPSVVQRARELSVQRRNIRFMEDDFMTWTGDGAYDYVSLIAVLHHLPFDDALARAVDLLRPRGSLVVLGLDRPPTLLHHCAQALIAGPVSRYYRVVRRTSDVGAPILEPTMTLSEIRQRAGALLPGAMVRRHVLWRYSLVWTKP
jgi:SAM-dependent methyltransferase